MATLRLTLPLPTLNHCYLSSSSSYCPLSLMPSFSSLSLQDRSAPCKPFIVRMGGGPRTFPGGVSKWQWKRMQKKKAKQLLKARLLRERQIYEMRKRAELKAAVSELERPWDTVDVVKQAAPTLFSVGADEQLKVLADRFQKPGGFDLWTERDGPKLYESPGDEDFPTARFFPKGVVHSVKPYGTAHSLDTDLGETRSRRGGRVLVLPEKIENADSKGRFASSARSKGSEGNTGGESSTDSGIRKSVRRGQRNRGSTRFDGNDGIGSDSSSSMLNPSDDGDYNQRGIRNHRHGNLRNDENMKKFGTGDANGIQRKALDSRESGYSARGKGRVTRFWSHGERLDGRGNELKPRKNFNSEDAYEMRLQGDGSYGLGGS